MKREEIYQLFEQRYGLKKTIIDLVIENDPSPTKKYSTYILNQHLKGNDFIEIFPIIRDFDALLPFLDNKDIYSADYSRLRWLEKAVNDAYAKKLIKEGFNLKSKDIIILAKTEDYILIHPKTYEASMKYGYGTKWCTTYKHKSEYFDKYKHNLVYLLAINPSQNYNYKKVAFYCSSSNFKKMQIFNPSDDEIFKNKLKENMNLKDMNKILRIYKRFIHRERFFKLKMIFPNSITRKVYKSYLPNDIRTCLSVQK